MKTGILNKPKIFKRDGRWQLCHPLPAKTFNIELISAAYSYCERMNSKCASLTITNVATGTTGRVLL